VLFVGSGPVLAQDNLNLFWNQGSARLGIGTNVNAAKLGVAGNVAIGSTYAGSPVTPNGLLVESRIAIGNSTPGSSTLSVGGISGSVAIGSTYVTSTAPLNSLIVEGRIGIGTAAPNPSLRLAVNGSVSIGSTYFSSAAPTDGLLVEGQVGIGTLLPSGMLHVKTGSNPSLVVEQTASNSLIQGVSGSTVFEVDSSGRVGIAGSSANGFYGLTIGSNGTAGRLVFSGFAASTLFPSAGSLCTSEAYLTLDSFTNALMYCDQGSSSWTVIT
jgi:hypothetical protein